jgi:hypothetical protein
LEFLELPTYFGLAHIDACFRSPTRIFWCFSLPLVGVVVAFAFALLPSSGRLALASTVTMIVLLEAGFGAADAWFHPEVETHTDRSYYQPHPTLGYGPKRGIRARAWKRVDERLLYDVEYEIDERGRRVTTVEGRADRDRFLLFFGGSFVFGEGVEARATLPYLVSTHAVRHVPYNYAFHGYGPNQLLAKLESGELRGEVVESEGALVYGFIDAHVRRAIGSMVVYTGWAWSAPCYVLDGEARVRRVGTFTTARPWTAIGFSLLGRSRLLRRFHVDLPFVISDRHVELTAQIFAEAAARFRETFGPQRFVVVAYPEHWPSPLAARLGHALRGEKIEFLDYSRLLAPDRDAYFFPEDRHPNGLAHRAVAERLVADLGLAEARPLTRAGAEAPRE